MKYKKGLALLLAAALMISMAPQTGRLVSASEMPGVQESVPEDSYAEAGTDSKAPESKTEDADAEAGTDSKAPESKTEDADVETGTDSKAPESKTEDADAEAGTDSKAPGSGTEGSGSEVGTDSKAPESGAEDSGSEAGTEGSGSGAGTDSTTPNDGGADTDASAPGKVPSGQDGGADASASDEDQKDEGFDGEYGISPFSLLPLEEVEAQVELYEADYSKVPLETILRRMRDMDGNLIFPESPEGEVALAYNVEDYQNYKRDAVVDLSGLRNDKVIRLEIGKATQLDYQAVRYIVKVKLYDVSATENIGYTVYYYENTDSSGSPIGSNSSYNEYGSVSIEGLDVPMPVTLVRYAARTKGRADGEFGLSISSRIANGGAFGDDIQVSVYQMKTFLGAYHKETKTIDENAEKLEILGSSKRGAYGELNPENPIEYDNLFCIVYTDTATGKVVEYQGLAFIASPEELLLKGNLYEEVEKGPIVPNLGKKLYYGIQWNVDVSGEPGKGSVKYSQDYLYSTTLPAGYPADKTYPYIIQNPDGMIERVEVSDSSDSWSGEDITTAVLANGGTLPSGYGIKCGNPVYFIVYAKGGMVLRYYVNISQPGTSASYSYKYQIKGSDGTDSTVGYGSDFLYKDEQHGETGIHVTPVVVYSRSAESLDKEASYSLSMTANGRNTFNINVYRMEDFLACYGDDGKISGLEAKSAITDQILGQNAAGYEGKYADPGSSNVFAIVYSSPYDGKVVAYHAISVKLAGKMPSIKGEFRTDVGGQLTKVSSNTSSSWISSDPSVEYQVYSWREYASISGSCSNGTIRSTETMYDGYRYKNENYFYIMEGNSDIEKVEAGSGSQKTDITEKIFTEGYPARNFQVTFKDGTVWNYSVDRNENSRQKLNDESYWYTLYTAGDTRKYCTLRKTEYAPYALPDGTKLPVDVTKVTLYLDSDKCGEGQEYDLRVSGATLSSQITREVYLMKDFMAYYEAKEAGEDAELNDGITDIFNQSGSNGHRGSYGALQEGTDPTGADNMFCIVYRHKDTKEIMACQGLLLQIQPYAFNVKGTLYAVKDGKSTPFPANAVRPSEPTPRYENSATYRVNEAAGTAVSKYQSEGNYKNPIGKVVYTYTLAQGYGADKYAYVLEVPGGDRENVKIFLGSYGSIQEAKAAGAEDITNAILPEDETSEPFGYMANYSSPSPVEMTAFVGTDQVMQYSIKAISNDQSIEWQYTIYAREAEDSSTTPTVVPAEGISKTVYTPYSLAGVDIPITKVLYYVSGEDFRDTTTWSFRMQLKSTPSYITTSIYQMKDFLAKEDDLTSLGNGITGIINGYGYGQTGGYQDPGSNALEADNLFCIVYTNSRTKEIVSYQGLLFVIDNKNAAPQTSGSFGALYQKGEDGALKKVEDCEPESHFTHDSDNPTWGIGGASASLPAADSAEYIYSWASEESDTGDYRYVLDQNDSIEKVVEGAYETAEAAKAGKEITEAILQKGEKLPEGYSLHLGDSADNPFTVIFKDGSVLKLNVTVHIRETITPSADQVPPEYVKPKTYGDPYFRVTGAVAYTDDKDGKNYVYRSNNGEQEGRQTDFPAEDGYVEKQGQVYVVRNTEAVTLDVTYNYGYQTVFIADEDVDLTKIAPIFELGKGNSGEEVKAYVGRRQGSGEKGSIHDFSNGSVLYNVFIGSSLRNYQVTIAKKTTDGANLFVSGPDTREVFLTQTHERKHDILIANLGDKPLKDLTVTLEDAEHVRLDDYWIVGGENNKELAAFDGAASGANGEMQNLAKIRLLPTEEDGEVKGTLKISAKDDEGHTFEKTIELSGWAINPEITTTKLDYAVKFVPYSYVISTNNMHYEWNTVKFSIVENPEVDSESEEAKWYRLPEGLELNEDTGEIYGLPQEDSVGLYHITVKAEYSRTDLFEPSIVQFELEVRENEDETVYMQSDGAEAGSDKNYKIMTPVGVDEGGYYFRVAQIIDWPFDSFGPYGEFMDLYLNGQKLVRGVDYTDSEGSTKIVVLQQTFENKARKEGRRNTLAAEFRDNGERETDNQVNALHRTAQNFYLDLEEVEASPSPSPDPTDDPGTETPGPGTTTPDPGTDTPDPGTGTPEPGTTTPEPGTVTPEPGNRPTSTPNPGNRPTSTPEPGNRPTATPNPGNRPTATPNPGNRPDSTAVPIPGGQPGTTSAPGGQPGTNPAPGGQPGTNPVPGDQGGTGPVPGGQPGTNPAPGGQGGTNPAPGAQPGTNLASGTQAGTNPAPGAQPGTNQNPDSQDETQPGTESASGGQDAAASAPESPSDAGSGTEGGAVNINTATIIARMADPEGNPYAGYTMEIHSEPKSALLDQGGTAAFADIEGGSHVMYVKDPKGDTVATKEFELAVGDTVSLAGNQVSVKAGGTYTLSIQLEDDRLDFLSLEEGDTRNVQLSKARNGMNPFFWVVIAALFLGVCGSGAWVYLKGKKSNKKNR